MLVREPRLALARRVAVGDEGVEHRQHEQREQRADRHAGGDDEADREARLGAGAGSDDERHHAEHHGGGGHQDRPQPDARRLHDRLALRQPMLLALLVGELHHQDAVLGDEADQRDQPHLRIDVERGDAEIERHQRSEDRKRHGQHDDERIAEALELRRQHQVDDDDGEAEGDERRVALVHLQPRLPGEILVEAGRHHLGGDLADGGERVAGRDAGQRDAGNGGGIQLVELLDRHRRGARLHIDDRRQRHHRRRSCCARRTRRGSRD